MENERVHSANAHAIARTVAVALADSAAVPGANAIAVANATTHTTISAKSMKVALIPGHGPSIDKGAENTDGTTELAWNRDLVSRVQFHLNGKVESVIVNRVKERLSPVPEINATRADIAIEFHCNASDGRASGTEMIYYEGSKAGRKLAEALLSRTVEALKLPNRGVKTPFAGRGNYFLSKTKMPAVIAESMFIDNSSDLRIATERKEELARGYAAAILSFSV